MGVSNGHRGLSLTAGSRRRREALLFLFFLGMCTEDGLVLGPSKTLKAAEVCTRLI